LGQDQSTNSFAVIEIKTPESELVGSIYRGDRGSGLRSESYSISSEVSGGLIQLQNQIDVAITSFQNNIGYDFADNKIGHFNPHGVLIVGSMNRLSEAQKRSFLLFRKSVQK
jgi:hypothetical protein